VAALVPLSIWVLPRHTIRTFCAISTPRRN